MKFIPKLNTKTLGPYSPAVGVAGGSEILFLSGQIPLDGVTGTLNGDTIEEQTRQVFTNIRGLLADLNLDFSHIVKTTVFLKNMRDFASMNAVYTTFFPQDPPARTTVEVSALPKEALIEIECIVCR